MKQRKLGRGLGYTAIEALESPEVYERARRIHYTMQDNGSATGARHRITDEQIWAAVEALDREQAGGLAGSSG